MAHRRKSSPGCAECRKRRTRCDGARPACGQCVRMKRECHGYRKLEDLMFCDESEKAAKKSHRAVASSSSSSSSSGSSPPRHFTPPARGGPIIISEYTTPLKLTSAVFKQDLNDLALGFFMSNYVGSDAMTSQFDFLPSLYSREGYANSGLQQSIRAVGLAGLAKSTERDDLIQTSRKSYVAALQKINKALSDPKVAAEDSTLSSILVMGVYEVMLLPNTSGLSNLTKHLDGALSLATMRLGQQKKTGIGMKMIGSLVHSVIMNSWIQNIPLPAEFYALRRRLGEQPNPPTVHAIFLDHLVDLIEFRHAMNEYRYATPNAVIYEAVRIDKRLVGFLKEMPKDGQYHSVFAPKERSEMVYDQLYHVYPNNISAHLWNSVRSSRLRLHRIIIMKIVEILKSPSQDDLSSLADQKAISEDIVRSLARDICASVPQLAGYLENLNSYNDRDAGGNPTVPRPTSSSLEPTPHFLYDRGQLKQPAAFLLSPVQEHPRASSTQGTPNASAPRKASLYNILYLLYVLVPVAILPAEMKRWIQQRIKWIEAKTEPANLVLLKAMLENKAQHGPAWVSADLKPIVDEQTPR